MSLFTWFTAKKKQEAAAKDSSLVVTAREFTQTCVLLGATWIRALEERRLTDAPAFARYFSLPSHYANHSPEEQAIFYQALTEGRDLLLTSLFDLLSGKEWDDLTTLDLVDAVQNYYHYYEDGHLRKDYIEKAKKQYPQAKNKKEGYENFLRALCQMDVSLTLLQGFAKGAAVPVREKMTAQPEKHAELLAAYFSGASPKIANILYDTVEIKYIKSPVIQAEIRQRTGT